MSATPPPPLPENWPNTPTRASMLARQDTLGEIEPPAKRLRPLSLLCCREMHPPRAAPAAKTAPSPAASSAPIEKALAKTPALKPRPALAPRPGRSASVSSIASTSSLKKGDNSLQDVFKARARRQSELSRKLNRRSSSTVSRPQHHGSARPLSVPFIGKAQLHGKCKSKCDPQRCSSPEIKCRHQSEAKTSRNFTS